MVMDRAGEREFGWCGRDQTEAALGRAFATALVGLVYMHSCGVAHLDVKPANILVDRAHSATLIDFGLSLMQRESTRAAGTLPYIAPEICKRAVPHVRAYNTFKSDVWSLGISLFAAAAGFHPWALANVHEQSGRYRRVYNAQGRAAHLGFSATWLLLSTPLSDELAATFPGMVGPATEEELSPCLSSPAAPLLVKLLDGMLVIDPDRRPDLRGVCRLAHEWLAAVCPAEQRRVGAVLAAAESGASPLGAAVAAAAAGEKEQTFGHPGDGARADSADESNDPVYRSSFRSSGSVRSSRGSGHLRLIEAEEAEREKQEGESGGQLEGGSGGQLEGGLREESNCSNCSRSSEGRLREWLDELDEESEERKRHPDALSRQRAEAAGRSFNNRTAQEGWQRAEAAARDAFAACDADGSGAIDRCEFGAVLRLLGLPPELEEPMMAVADANGDSLVSYAELRALLIKFGAVPLAGEAAAAAGAEEEEAASDGTAAPAARRRGESREVLTSSAPPAQSGGCRRNVKPLLQRAQQRRLVERLACDRLAQLRGVPKLQVEREPRASRDGAERSCARAAVALTCPVRTLRLQACGRFDALDELSDTEDADDVAAFDSWRTGEPQIHRYSSPRGVDASLDPSSGEPAAEVGARLKPPPAGEVAAALAWPEHARVLR